MINNHQIRLGVLETNLFFCLQLKKGNKSYELGSKSLIIFRNKMVE